MLDTNKGQMLLNLARAAIGEKLGFASPDFPHADWLESPGATFVTLTLHGQLRGCIGSLEAYCPLIDDVRHNAVSAAFQDPRFEPLSKQEFAEVIIEVSLLSKPAPLRFSSEQDVLAQLRPGVDGVVLEYLHHRGTYLPQVWEQLPDPRQFLAHLKNKSGLSKDFWSDDIQVSRYTVQKWHEGAHHG